MPGSLSSSIEVCIVVEGHLSTRRSGWFEGLTLTSQPEGDSGTCTQITGRLPDYAALYGLISRIRDLGLKLVSLNVSNSPDE